MIITNLAEAPRVNVDEPEDEKTCLRSSSGDIPNSDAAFWADPGLAN